MCNDQVPRHIDWVYDKSNQFLKRVVVDNTNIVVNINLVTSVKVIKRSVIKKTIVVLVEWRVFQRIWIIITVVSAFECVPGSLDGLS